MRLKTLSMMFFVTAGMCGTAFGEEYWTFGSQRLYVDEEYPGIIEVLPLGNEALKSYSYLGKVGGVNFESAAISEESAGLLFSNFERGANDPNYTDLIFNTKFGHMSLAIPDWILYPAVLFANSEYTAAVSLFGDGPDIDSNFYITYHPALKDTLVGTRILQADIVLMDPGEFCSFPKYRGKLILAPGEYMSDPLVSRKAAKALEDFTASTIIQAWLLTDIGEKLQVDITRGELNLSLKPYFHFWVGKEVVQYLAQRLALEIRLHGEKQPPSKEIEKLLSGLEKELESGELVVSLDKQTNWLKTRRNLLEDCNPSLFDTVDTFAALAATFRNIKQGYPLRWSRLVQAASDWRRESKVQTPTRWPKGL